MYDLENAPESRYGFSDDLPSNEKLDEDVLVHQDLDLSGADVEELKSFIDSASQDAQDSLGRLELVQETLRQTKSGSPVLDRQIQSRLHANQTLRHAKSRKYGFVPSKLASEALDEGQVVLALEGEEKEERGFFRKIIDKIAEAFKWLWKKLTGLFSSGEEKKEKLAEKADEEAKILKDIDPDKIKSMALEIDAKRIQAAYGFLGKHVTIRDLTDHFGTVADQVVTVEVLGNAISDTFEFFVESIQSIHPESSEAEMDDLWKKATSLILSVYGSLPKASRSEIESIRDTQDEIVGDGYKIERLSFNRTAYFWGERRPDGRSDLKSFITTKQELNQSVEFDPPIGNSASELSDMVQRVHDRSLKVDKLLKNHFEKNEKRTQRIVETFDRLLASDQAKHNDNENVRLLSTLAQAMGRNLSNLSTTLSGIEHNITQGLEAVVDFMYRTRIEAKKAESSEKQ